jgi:guanylate kinase
MSNKIIIVGKGASGKNVLMERFEKRGFRHLVSHTTRPMRDCEVDGKEYHFVSNEEFEKMINEGKFVEYQKFGGFYYGTSTKEWDLSDVVIMAPQGIQNLRNLGIRENCFVIYIDIPYHTRRDRLKLRCKTVKEYENIEKRLLIDEEEFKGFVDYDMVIKTEF